MQKMPVTTIQQVEKSQRLLLGINNLARTEKLIFGPKTPFAGTIVPQTVPHLFLYLPPFPHTQSVT
jgi:hypothetical protein